MLQPLGPCGNLRYTPKHFDLHSDSNVPEHFLIACANAIIIVDGIFLQRPELVNYWDFVIFVKTDFEYTLGRMLERDNETTESYEETNRMFKKRYRLGQELYLELVGPMYSADVVCENNTFENLKLFNKGANL